MAKKTYVEMEDALRFRETFKGSNVHADTEDGIYKVWSYQTHIFSKKGQGEVWLDNKYYSHTTSKIQNMLIRVFNLNDGIEKRS